MLAALTHRIAVQSILSILHAAHAISNDNDLDPWVRNINRSQAVKILGLCRGCAEIRMERSPEDRMRDARRTYQLVTTATVEYGSSPGCIPSDPPAPREDA